MKAVASDRGICLGMHRSIAGFVAKLDEEHPDLRLREAFLHAESLLEADYDYSPDYIRFAGFLRSPEACVKRFSFKIVAIL